MKIPGSNRQSIQQRYRLPIGKRLSRQIRGRRSIRGSGLIELLIASLLLCIGVMGLVSTWAFSYRVTQLTDDRGIAYNLGRQAIERAKMTGFTNTSEGSATLYYDGDQTLQGSSATARFSVTTNVVSDSMQSGSSGVSGGVPASTALRTVTITVQTVSPVQTLYTTTTYLARAGV